MFRPASLLALLAAGPALGQPVFVVPKAVPQDPAALKQIDDRTAELRKAVAVIPATTPDDIRADVEVYLKAAEWIVRHGEWFSKDSAKQTLAVLDAGLARAKDAAAGKAPWRAVRGKPVVRGYRSQVDGSVQPFTVVLPEGFGTDGKKHRLDVVLHGRNGTLTEAGFIARAEAAKPGAAQPFAVAEPYGRGNNAYRWAGEADVFEVIDAVKASNAVDPARVVLRGFSMGGAGTWHLGLHQPFDFAVIGPGAGFTTTRGYIKDLPAVLPEHQEKCLHIYDAVDYTENAFNVPVVAYSGEKDAQKAAADNIEHALKGFKLTLRFTHLIAPGLEHQMPAEWQAKAQAEYAKYAGPGRQPNEPVRFVTYTPAYGDFGVGQVIGLERQYEKAVVEVVPKDGLTEVRTANVRELHLAGVKGPVAIDGQKVEHDSLHDYVKADGRWRVASAQDRRDQRAARPEKVVDLQGPIDDAFRSGFVVVPPTGNKPAELTRFANEWDKFFRGTLPATTPDKLPSDKHLVLFGTPETNPVIAKVLPKLPITWTTDKLVVNGVEYDPKTHVPVLIYPNPLNPTKYVVINSGHTFHAAELTGTNAQLYPRLGDWAVLKGNEVVAAGLFDENWKFVKK